MEWTGMQGWQRWRYDGTYYRRVLVGNETQTRTGCLSDVDKLLWGMIDDDQLQIDLANRRKVLYDLYQVTEILR